MLLSEVDVPCEVIFRAKVRQNLEVKKTIHLNWTIFETKQFLIIEIPALESTIENITLTYLDFELDNYKKMNEYIVKVQ